MKWKSFTLFGSFCILFCCFLTTCEREISEGERLAKVRCSSCHLFPEPELLSKKIWKNKVLPQMAFYFGLQMGGSKPYEGASYEDFQALKKAKIYPEQATITKEEWTAIVNYYYDEAPTTPKPIKKKKLIPTNLDLFELNPIHLGLKEGPLTTMIHFENKTQKIWVSDLRDTLYQVSTDGSILAKDKLLSLTSDMIIHEDSSLYLLAMGYIHPKDTPLGKLLRKNSNGDLDTLIEDLHRPVDLEIGDLNQDGKEDFVICTYGHNIGHFSWYEQLDSNQFKEHILRELPGAIKSYIRDFNDDNLPDILTLMGQGDEGVILYYNQGGGQFKAEQVLRFNPLYGSSFIDLVDYEGDGDLDILLANGDNADYSAIPKNYHGVRLFINDGHNQFEEAFFFPMYGATKALLHDFDQDGDKDIAVIAYFPEYDIAPEEGFAFLENVNSGSFKFKASTIENATLGRWLIMEKGDLDADGDEDLFLGGLFYAPSPSPPMLKANWVLNGANVLVLRNQSSN